MLHKSFTKKKNPNNIMSIVLKSQYKGRYPNNHMKIHFEVSVISDIDIQP